MTYNTANNRLSTSGYTYDAAGNMTYDGINTYTYDAEGNITAVSGNATATYVYNALNQRVRTTVNTGTPTEFVFNANGQRVSEWNGSTRAQLKGKYYWGGTPVAYYTTAASSAGAGAHFEHQDWLGTERMRTSYNSGNNPAYAVEGTFTSEPWGDAQTVASGTDLDASHYATLDYDAETATDHAQFRQYGDTPGNWMSPDPYYGSYDQSNPQSMNRYAYVLDSPLSNIDPSGLTNCPPYGCTSNPNGGGNGNCLLDGMPVDCSMTGGLVQAGSAYNIPQNIDGGLFAFDQTIYSGRSMYILVNGSDGPVWESVAMGANSIGLGVEILSPEAAAEAGLPDLNNIDDQLIAANNNFDPDDPSYQLAVALGKTGAYSMTSVCFVPAFYAASGTFAAGGVAVANSGEIVSAAAENYPSLIHRAWMWFNNLVGKPPAPVSVITATAATASGISHFCNHH